MLQVKLKFALLLTVIAFIFSGCHPDPHNINFEEIVVIANRASGSVSFIDAKTDVVVDSLSIPGSQPMYAVYVSKTDRIYVGDRSQNQVHVIDPETRTVETSINVGNGVFHMWADGKGRQLWVNNDVDFTTSVIDLSSNTVVATINLGIKPHDVFVNKHATYAYISVLTGDAATADSIYRYSTSTFTKTHAQAVGKDPHVYHLALSNQLYVPCQSGELFALDGNDLSVISSLPLVGAHGIFAPRFENFIYVAGISAAELNTIDPATNTQIGSPVSTPVATPHNLVVTRNGNKLFVTHSGSSANTVTSYSISAGALTLHASITVGTNPFGLAYYKRKTH